MTFSEWLTRKYIEWRGDAIGHDRSMSDFGKLFGASSSLMTQWMAKDGKVPTSSKYISALVKVYGDEVYDILGLPKPVSISGLENLPPGYQYIRDAVSEASRLIRDRNLPNDSDEAEEIYKEVLTKYGMHYLETKRGE